MGTFKNRVICRLHKYFELVPTLLYHDTQFQVSNASLEHAPSLLLPVLLAHYLLRLARAPKRRSYSEDTTRNVMVAIAVITITSSYPIFIVFLLWFELTWATRRYIHLHPSSGGCAGECLRTSMSPSREPHSNTGY